MQWATVACCAILQCRDDCNFKALSTYGVRRADHSDIDIGPTLELPLGENNLN